MTNASAGKSESREKEMADCIEAFRVTFRMRFGVSPYVSLDQRGEYGDSLNITELLSIVDRMVRDTGVGTEGSLMNKRRHKGLVLYRHAFCRMAHGLGYTNSEIARKTGMDRVSVLHAVRSIEDKLKIKDKDTVECVQAIRREIEFYLSGRDSLKTA